MAKDVPKPNYKSVPNDKSPGFRCKGNAEEGEWTQGNSQGGEGYLAEQQWLLQEIRGKYTEKSYLAPQLMKSGSSFSGGFYKKPTVTLSYLQVSFACSDFGLVF